MPLDLVLCMETTQHLTFISSTLERSVFIEEYRIVTGAEQENLLVSSAKAESTVSRVTVEPRIGVTADG